MGLNDDQLKRIASLLREECGSHGGSWRGQMVRVTRCVITLYWYSGTPTMFHIKMVLTGTLLIFEFILVLSRCDQMCNYIMLLYSY